MTTKKPTGVILYEGKSLFDGKDIIVIATGINNSSANEKTGAMVQTWILLKDETVKPHEAIKSGQDASVCGDCMHRPANGGACYVQVHNAPRSVWAAYHRGNYPKLSEFDVNPLAGKLVRLGAYGDPAMIPVSVWDEVLKDSVGFTGYTHQWKWCDKTISKYVMASADSVQDLEDAQALGYRTFRVRTANEPLAPKESVCPASAEGGKKLNCATCKACNGTSTNRKGSIAIIVHGAKAKRFTSQVAI
tara:strand:+ start:552 stop:1292 length:741 start_codon:yes stop_codon:yes gene_type:complete